MNRVETLLAISIVLILVGFFTANALFFLGGFVLMIMAFFTDNGTHDGF